MRMKTRQITERERDAINEARRRMLLAKREDGYILQSGRTVRAAN